MQSKLQSRSSRRSPRRVEGNTKTAGSGCDVNPLEQTRDRILRIATIEFAKHSYSGARVETICQEADVNPRMIYHYFGNKDGLYIAVLEQVIGQLRTAELNLDTSSVEPLEGLLHLFDFSYDHFGRHPELIHLLSGENLLGARFLRRSTETPIVASPVLSLIRDLLTRGRASGAIRPGLDPLHLYVSMIALCYFHRSNVHTLSAIFETKVGADAWQRRHKTLAREMVRRILAP